jgi:DNA-binding beta-propeller fold protein YncE
MHVNADGSLTLLGINRHGCPRELAATPDNKNLYVADACAHVIFQYRAFPGGVLTEQIPFSVPSGTVLAMAPAPNNKTLYVTIDNGTQNLAAYPIAKNGLLAAPATYSTGAGSWGIAVRR